MENSQLHDFEEGFCRWMSGLRLVEDLASNISAEVEELEQDIAMKNKFQKDLDENFNIERDDLGIYYGIQHDKDTEAYIRQLEKTFEVIMQKYREHTQQKITDTKLEFEEMRKDIAECNYKSRIEKQGKVIDGLVSMMDEFLRDGQAITTQLLAQNTMLKTENRYLRTLAHWPQAETEMKQDEDESDNESNTTVKSMDLE